MEHDFRSARLGPARIVPSAFFTAGQRQVAAGIVDILDRDAAIGHEPPYHSRHHVAESVVAMDLLCQQAIKLGLITPELAALGALAMVGHDLGHDGTLPDTTRLEEYAAAEVAKLAAGLGAAAVAVMTEVILATAPSRVTDNLARARSPQATPMDMLCAIANEADVLASLLPTLGWELGDLLAEEWSVHSPTRAALARSFIGRRTFLQLYARSTPVAASLGLTRVIARGIDAFAPDGPQALDQMPRAEAMARYNERLGAMPV